MSYEIPFSSKVNEKTIVDFNANHYPYSSRRNVVYSKKGMVATSQPLAAQAGLSILQQGGNAIDAAIATAACLTVVEPTSNGIGGDAFALVWTKGKLHGLNSSGPSSKNISIEILKNKGINEIPKYGWIPVTVPGAPAAWAELSKKFGKLPFIELMKPAIEYAEKGYPVSPTLSRYWKQAFETYRKHGKSEEFTYWFETFAPQGRAPEAGEVWRSPGHARTLQLIGETLAESFYRGELANQIDEFSKKYQGYLCKEDLESFTPEWVTPISVRYRGYDVWEIPPNGQGIIALSALKMLSGFDFSSRDTVDTFHKQIEAVKLAFADGLKFITQNDRMDVSIEGLLSDSYADMRRKMIGERALQPTVGEPPKGGTVYLAAADEEGNMVSFIQSNYMGFGSGLVVPGTGISLQNRGHNFSLDPNHCNCLEPAKKTYHTIIPGFLTKDDQPVGPFGVMGGFMQPQGHVQVVMNLIDFHLNPQAAIDAPRWKWTANKTVELEHGVPEHIAFALLEKGHDIKWQLDPYSFGRGQVIIRNDNGVLCGGTEPRTDGMVAVW